MKKAILVVSFGTTFDDTREKTIGAIENRIKYEFSDYIVERAFTSSVVIKRLKDRGINIKNVDEALKSLSDSGVEYVVIQPTHIIAGYEYEKIVNTSKVYKNRFKDIVIGKPLLYNEIDYKNTAQFIDNKFGSYNGMVILMGHGSVHSSDSAYAKLQSMIKSDNIQIATVEGCVTFDDIIDKIKYKNILLAPFMVVCGDHAKNDLAVEWKNAFEKAGYSVELCLKGLGEYSEIQNIYVEHIKGVL